MNDPDFSAFQPTEEEINNSRATGVTTPDPGSHVLYRHHEWGDVTDAILVDIVTPHNDPTVTAFSLHPWHLVELDTAYGRVQTRQARVRGSAGWLPLDWLEIA